MLHPSDEGSSAAGSIPLPSRSAPPPTSTTALSSASDTTASSAGDTLNPAEPGPIRVALFTGAYDHIRDGVSLTLNRLVAYLERNSVPARVFAPTVRQPALQHAGTRIAVPSIPAPGRGEYRVSLGLTPGVRKQLESFQPTLVHIATPDLLGRAALRWARRNRVPVVSSYHTHFASYLNYYGLQGLENQLWGYLRRFYKQCRHVYVPSSSMENVLREHGIDGNLLPWPRGVDTGLFNPKVRSAEWRASTGAGDRDVIVTFVSRIVAEKGVGLFADVVEQLEERGVPHRSVVVGDGPLRESLQERLKNTHFTGTLQAQALAHAYASSDVFVFPSETETFGNVTLEAMASGVPAVCADATGSSSLVRPGATGFLAPPRDAAAFREHVERLCSDHELRARLSATSREVALEYDWEIVLARMLAYYREAV